MIEIKFREDKVYISYSHEDGKAEDVVLKLVKQFQGDENIVEVVLTVK